MFIVGRTPFSDGPVIATSYYEHLTQADR